MFLTQIYHLSTAGRVELKLGNSERPNVHCPVNDSPTLDVSIIASLSLPMKKIEARH